MCFHILGMIIPTDSCFSVGLKLPTSLVFRQRWWKFMVFHLDLMGFHEKLIVFAWGFIVCDVVAVVI